MKLLKTLWERILIYLLEKDMDSLTGLKTIFMLIPEIKRQLKKGRRVDLLYFDIKKFSQVEATHGKEVCYQILSFIGKELLILKNELAKDSYKVELVYGGGDDFIFLIFHPLKTQRTSKQIARYIKETILAKLKKSSHPSVDLHHGSTIIKSQGQDNLDHLIYRKLKIASLKAKDNQYKEHLKEKKKMEDIIREVKVYPVYQPILCLQTGEIYGREALLRANQEINMNPGQLFGLARKTGQLLNLERLARKLAIRGAKKRNTIDEKVFINITPDVINDLNFKAGETLRLLNQSNLKPEDIVLEITESSAIKDFSLFKKTVEHYRNQGYQIAVDDAGAGFSTLQVIAELHPDFIKIDMSLVRNIDKTPIKRAIVEAMITFSKKMGVQLVGEGIETFAELESLLELGVDYGQGYLIARPREISQDAAGNVIETCIQHYQMLELNKKVKTNELKEIIQFIQTITPDMLVKDVVDIFREYPGMQGVVVVDEGQKPIGLVMKDYLYYKLGSAYGVALFMNRPISKLMDNTPLIVGVDTDLSTIARMSMKRERRKLYDLIIITRGDLYYGAVSVRSLLEKINRIQVEMARETNPLTGLPGNHLIEKELTHRINTNKSFGVIYVDLDNFKEFNDHFGYDFGDKILLKMASWCQGAVEETDEKSTGFVGHIGGDDFVIIIDNSTTVTADRLIEIFQREIMNLYEEHNLSLNTVKVKNRKGNMVEMGILSVSLASGIYNGKEYSSHHLISRELAILKGKAKEIPGCSHYSQADCYEIENCCIQ